MKSKSPIQISRREFLRCSAAAAGGLILASCAPTPVQPPTAVPPTQTPSTLAPTPTAAGPLKINVMWRGPTNPVNKDGNVYKQLVDRTGVAYEGFGLPPGPDYTQKVNAVMASGDPPHLMWINDRTAYFQYAKQGAFWQLDEFLADKKAFPILTSYPDAAYDTLRVDGNLYAIPSARVYRGFPVHIRTDWLDKFSLKMPTTVDQVWQAAEAFATRDPDGNGKKDTYGLMWWQQLQGLDQILNGFGILSTWEEDKPKHIIPAFIMPKYKQMLAWLRQGIQEGIFDPDSVIMKRDEMETVKGNAGKCGIHYTGLGGQTLNALQKNLPSAQLMPMPLLLTPEGKYAYGIPYYYIGMWVITKAVKKKEDVLRILKFLDYGSSDEGNDLMNYGVPGDYDTRADGTKVVNDKGNADGAGALWLIPPQDKYLYVQLEQASGHPELAEAQRKLVDSVETVAFPDPILFTLIGPIELQKGGDLSSKRDEIFSKIMAGQLPVDAFDDWVKEWRTGGGDQIIEERNQSYAQIKK